MAVGVNQRLLHTTRDSTAEAHGRPRVTVTRQKDVYSTRLHPKVPEVQNQAELVCSLEVRLPPGVGWGWRSNEPLTEVRSRSIRMVTGGIL